MNNPQTEGVAPLITANPNNTPDVYPTLPTVGTAAAPVSIWVLAGGDCPTFYAVSLDLEGLRQNANQRNDEWWGSLEEEERAEFTEGKPDPFERRAPVKLEGSPDILAEIIGESFWPEDGRAILSELGIVTSPKRRRSPPVAAEEVSGKSEPAAPPPPPPPLSDSERLERQKHEVTGEAFWVICNMNLDLKGLQNLVCLLRGLVGQPESGAAITGLVCALITDSKKGNVERLLSVLTTFGYDELRALSNLVHRLSLRPTGQRFGKSGRRLRSGVR